MADQVKKQRVTIRTVAEDAGVSVSAVSKVLRDAYGVSEALRAKVRASIERLGYRPHIAARGMRGQTYTLGLILPDLHNPFFADILAGMNTALERTQYQLLIGVCESDPGTEAALIEEMVDRMDGVILLGSRIGDQPLAEVASRIPTVVIAIHPDAQTNFDTVNNDDVLGAKLVVQHLAAAGYKHITFLSQQISANEKAMVTTRRESGYRATMADVGLAKNVQVIYAGQTPREAQNAARHLLEQRNRPDAIFCWTDFIALEVLSVARELGLDVPGDLGVVGYDNTSYCDLAQNALTSIDQSGQVLGLQAARLLIERIKGREASEHYVVTPRLVARGSSAGPARR